MAPEPQIRAEPEVPETGVPIKAVPHMPQVTATLSLPIQIVTQTDVSRLCREVEALNEFFTQAAIKGAQAKTVPSSSQSLNTLISDNGLNMLKQEDRNSLKFFLDNIRNKAPVVSASFATDPKADFLMKLAAWFRTEAHPYVLLKVGLQPNIAAGCVIRTSNKYFDFSFRNQFSLSKEKLSAALNKVEV